MRSFWIVQIFAKWGHGNDVSAVFSAVACLVPRCPKNNHSTLASAQGFAPQIRIHGRDVTEKRTHGHDTSFAFWNLNKNTSRSLWCLQPCGLLADCSYTGIYRGREEFCKRQRQMQAHAGTMKRGPLGSFRFYFKMPPSLFGISQSIKQQQKRRWGRVGEKRGGFVCGVSELCRFLPNEVMATMSRQYSPQSPAWSQDVPRITIRPLPVHRASLHGSG